MEDKITGDKIDVYDIVLFDLPLQVKNITQYKLMTQPRRRYVKIVSCEVYLRRLRILILDHHWRPGEPLLELDWLLDKRQLQACYEQDCVKHFTKYCEEPVEFLLADDNFFIHLMRDPWCFNHEEVILCLLDFIQAYNCFYGCTVALNDFAPLTPEIEAKWSKAYHSEPEMADLIKSGFLVLDL